MTVLVVVKVFESLLVSLHVLRVKGEPRFDLLLAGSAPQDTGRAAQETGDTPWGGIRRRRTTGRVSLLFLRHAVS